MSSPKTRKRAARRDRRKAKASSWSRAPKNLGGKKGHGSTPGGQIFMQVKKKKAQKLKPERLSASPLKVSISDIIKEGEKG